MNAIRLTLSLPEASNVLRALRFFERSHGCCSALGIQSAALADRVEDALCPVIDDVRRDAQVVPKHAGSFTRGEIHV